MEEITFAKTRLTTLPWHGAVLRVTGPDFDLAVCPDHEAWGEYVQVKDEGCGLIRTEPFSRGLRQYVQRALADMRALQTNRVTYISRRQ